MLKFAEAITATCNDYLGFALNIPIKTASDSREKVLMDIMLSAEKGRNRQIQL